MGNQHPLSIRLKRNIKWYKLIYKWDGIDKHINEWVIINKIIEQKYKTRLISKPIYEYTSNEIIVVIYEYKKHEWYDSKSNQEIRELERGITEEIKKPIKIKVINLNYIQSDTKIMSRYYQSGLKNWSLARMRNKVKKMIKKIGTPLSLTEKKEKCHTNWYKWTEIMDKRLDSRILSGIRGIYIEIKGKISKQRRVKRRKKYTIRIGRLEFNKVSNILDYYQIKTIGVNGVYNIKICINTWMGMRG